MISNSQLIKTAAVLLIILVAIQSAQISDFSFINNFKHRRLDYPIRFTYINRITEWWPPSATLGQMAVPGYSQTHSYNYVAISFWTCQKGPIDISKMWDDPIKYFGEQLGQNKSEVQKFLKRKYNEGRVSIMLSAFGAAQYPTTLGLDPQVCAQKLGQYVKENIYDGVDIDYQDNKAMNNGTGEQWLIKFMKSLRKIIPFHIISHAPQGPYFSDAYVSGGYKRVHKQVGHLIDFYNVQFYNQLNSTYSTYQLLFKNSGSKDPKTSIYELAKYGGVPLDMLVVGKPASIDDVYNTGYNKPSQLAQFFIKADKQIGWNTGFMFWQYHSDRNGTISNQLSQILKSLSYNK